MPLGLDQKVGAVVWSPLGWARLTGKIRRGQHVRTSRASRTSATSMRTPGARRLPRRRRRPRCRRGRDWRTVPQIALNWLLQRPTVSTLVIGARNEEQLRQNIGAVGWNLTSEQVARLDAASAVTPIYPYWHQRGFADVIHSRRPDLRAAWIERRLCRVTREDL